MELLFATTNKNKLREASEILGFEIQGVAVDVPEIQDIKVDKVIEIKCYSAYEKLQKPLIGNNIFSDYLLKNK